MGSFHKRWTFVLSSVVQYLNKSFPYINGHKGIYMYIYININAKGNKKYTYKRNQKDVYVNGYKWIHIDSINELCSLTVLFFLQGIKDHGISIAFDTTQALCSIPHVRLGGMHRQAKTCLTFWMCPRDGYGFVLKKMWTDHQLTTNVFALGKLRNHGIFLRSSIFRQNLIQMP